MTTKIVVSGTHATVKQTMPVTKVMSSVKPAQPMKGTGNPPHIQTNISRFFAKLQKDNK